MRAVNRDMPMHGVAVVFGSVPKGTEVGDYVYGRLRENRFIVYRADPANSNTRVGVLRLHCRQRLCARLGRKRAVVALGHEILTIVYYLLTRGTTYQDLGLDYRPERERTNARRRAVRQLEALGYTVQITPTPKAA